MEALNFLLHVDEYLRDIIAQTGNLSYILLFLVIFCETGLVVMPFLPGDSLLFAVGTLAGSNILDIRIAIPVMMAASILGDSTNYLIGRKLGKRAFKKENARFFNPDNIAKTEDFYERHGGKTIILARFLPIVRTFAPFVAGVGRMHYPYFLGFSVLGSFLWVFLITMAGYLFGQVEIIKNNFELAIVGIVLFSFTPAIIEYVRHRGKKAKAKPTSYEDLEETFEERKLSD